MKKDEINRVVVPEDGGNLHRTGGRVTRAEQEDGTVLYIGHGDEEATDAGGNTSTVTRAFAVFVPRPVTRARAIDAAERAAYGLADADDVASFNAALARKSRMKEDLQEVNEHDVFIAWVKEELTKIGI